MYAFFKHRLPLSNYMFSAHIVIYCEIFNSFFLKFWKVLITWRSLQKVKARLDQSLLFFSNLVKKPPRFFFLTNKKSILFFHKVVCLYLSFYSSGIPWNAAIQHHKSRESNTTKDFEGYVITLLKCLSPYLSISQSQDLKPSKSRRLCSLLDLSLSLSPLRFSVPFSFFYLSQNILFIGSWCLINSTNLPYFYSD